MDAEAGPEYPREQADRAIPNNLANLNGLVDALRCLPSPQFADTSTYSPTPLHLDCQQILAHDNFTAVDPAHLTGHCFE